MAQEGIDSAAWQSSPQRVAHASAELLRLMAASLLGRPPKAIALHEQFAEAWNLNAAGADLVRTALIVSADHELNASSFTARCVASTQASLGAAIQGGLAALSGPLHGAATERVEAFWDEITTQTDVATAILRRLERGDGAPGFGHPLYPLGDPRARAILNGLPLDAPSKELIETVEKLTGYLPSIDVALVAMRRHLGCPSGAAFALFATGRTIGWLAHALEQRQQGQLIRPRARYVGNI
jgi:citrate synthase